ncbi:SprT family protein, partial [Priestia megaterium]|nr:SprT family protein [Priestia megaterium]
MNDKDLQILVEEISLKLFHKTFRHEATFNSRLSTTGGRYLLRTCNIEVNYKYFEQYGRQEIVEII